MQQQKIPVPKDERKRMATSEQVCKRNAEQTCYSVNGPLVESTDGMKTFSRCARCMRGFLVKSVSDFSPAPDAQL